MSVSEGKVHIYTGNGKGKTSAATGLCVRALGAGWNVYFIQFLKDGSSSEIRFLKEHGGNHFHHFACGSGCFIHGTPSEEERERAGKTLAEAAVALRSGNYDLVILDEAFGAIHAGLATERQLLDLITEKAPRTELVLTGRTPPQALLDRADLISDIHCVKHYFQTGRKALRGIEY